MKFFRSEFPPNSSSERLQSRRGARFSGDFRQFSELRTESSHRYQLPPHHPQVRQRKHRVQLGGVLRQSAVARLPEAYQQLLREIIRRRVFSRSFDERLSAMVEQISALR